MLQPLFILTCDTGRCYKNSINTATMKRLNDHHFLVRIIMSSTKQDTKTAYTGHFFDTFYNITKERIFNRCHYQADCAVTPGLQALCNGVGRITHLLCQMLDTLSCV